MTDAPTALIVQHDGWGELVLNRPQRRNAIIGPMVGELRAGLAALLAGGARVILLRGAGGAFCSGLDIDAFSADPPPVWRAGFQDDWAAWHRDLFACPATIIGALERHAINGAASMALACDLLVAGEGAFLLVGEAAQGMHAPMNVAWLRLKTTEAIAAHLALGATRMKADDLRRLGLAYEVVADDQVLASAQALAARLAGFPGAGLASIKAALRKSMPSDPAAIFDQVRAPGAATATTPQRI
jgi:1,4-dihydroxy-2-naphthoyl-CoA synthase